jgi:tetratricopeptide (TPR) repeat protein
VRAFIEDELLTDSGYRESIAEERVKKGFVAAGAPAEAVATLIDRRLLRVEERLDVRRVELTHDVLCGVVRASRDVRQAREAKTAAERLLAETQAKEAAGRGALHRARMVAAGCVVLAVGAAGAAVWGYVNFRRAEAAEDRVAQERDRVQASRAEAEKLVTFLLDDLHRQLEPTGKIEIVSGLARRALAYFDALPAELRDDRSERYRAVALSRLGSALSARGKTLEAEEPLLQAETIFRKLLEQGDRSTEVVLDLAAVLRQTSRNAYSQNRSRAAVDIGQRGAALIGPAAAAAEASVAVRYEQGRTQMNLGFVLMRDLQHGPALTSFEQATTVFRQLRDVPEARQRAEVMLAETSVWLAELLRLTGRGAEVDPLLAEAMQLADAAVQQEAGNLGALRSRGLVRGGLARAAADAGDHRKAEALARETIQDWTEFLRFDPDSETARNNRRAGEVRLRGALWRQGRLDELVTLGKAMDAAAMLDATAPSTLRGAAFQSERYGGMAAELGRFADAEAALANGNRLRNLAASQLEPESYLRAVTPLWNETVRAGHLQRLGRSEESLKVAREVEAKLSALTPNTGLQRTGTQALMNDNFRAQLMALLEIRQWAEAARVGRALLQGRPRADDTSVEALDDLAEDRARVAVALARAGEKAEARELIGQVETFFAGLRRMAGAMDHVTRYQFAQLALARGLIASEAAEKRAAFDAGLAQIAAMPPQPQQMRSTKALKAELESELAAVK